MAAQAEAEEEVRQELEAVAAVYGDDVRVLCDLPPHLVVHVRSRTADDSSQQLFLGIRASSQYPKEPPHIYAVESKGLDEGRQSYLIRSIQNKAIELSNYPMLVTLCEYDTIAEMVQIATDADNRFMHMSIREHKQALARIVELSQRFLRRFPRPVSCRTDGTPLIPCHPASSSSSNSIGRPYGVPSTSTHPPYTTTFSAPTCTSAGGTDDDVQEEEATSDVYR